MSVEDSILISSSRLAGISKDLLDDDESLNDEVITAINSNLNKLNQLGIGTVGFYITDDTSTWDEFYNDVPLEKRWFIREYIKLAVKKSVDPSNSTTLQQQYDEQMKELEFRLLVEQED